MIKIIKGVYGYMTPAGIVKPKTAEDAPFSLTAEQEKRLVDLGVAEYVAAANKAEPEIEPEQLPDLPEGVTGIPEYNANMKADELREIAKGMGLTFKANASKAAMVEAMDKYIEEHSVPGYNVDTGEIEDAEDDEKPPVFDAAEAVK